jgi:hypothetical protein
LYSQPACADEGVQDLVVEEDVDSGSDLVGMVAPDHTVAGARIVGLADAGQQQVRQAAACSDLCSVAAISRRERAMIARGKRAVANCETAGFCHTPADLAVPEVILHE